MVAACLAEVARPSLGTAIAQASHTSLASGALSEVRPAAFTAANTSAIAFLSISALLDEPCGAGGPGLLASRRRMAAQSLAYSNPNRKQHNDNGGIIANPAACAESRD